MKYIIICDTGRSRLSGKYTVQYTTQNNLERMIESIGSAGWTIIAVLQK